MQPWWKKPQNNNNNNNLTNPELLNSSVLPNQWKYGRRYIEGEGKEQVAAHWAARIVSCEIFSEESQGVQAGRRLCHYCVEMNDWSCIQFFVLDTTHHVFAFFMFSLFSFLCRRCVMDFPISPQLWHLTRCRRSLPSALVLEEYGCILFFPQWSNAVSSTV